MNVRWTLLPLLVAFPATVRAQSPKVLGRDDAEYARKLFENGYTDLAEKLVALVESSGNVAPKDQANLKALHLSVRLDLAQKETDPYKRKDLLKQILAEKEDLVKQYSGSSAAEDTANTLPDSYSMLGATVLACIAREKDVNLIAQLQQEGQKTFTTAEETLQKRIEELKERKDEPAVEGTYITALFNLPKTYYFHALLYPAGEWKKKELLEKAISAFQEFSLDYSDRLLNYEGCIFAGLSYKELGSKEDAVKSFDEAIALRELFEKDQKGVYQLDQASADVISKAVLQKVNMLLEGGTPKQAVDTAKDFFATVLSPYETNNGLAVLAAMGNSQISIGDDKGAGETADKLIELDGNGIWGQAGREIQRKLVEKGGGFDAAGLYKIGSSFVVRGQGEKALPLLRQAIQACKNSKEDKAVALDCWLMIGTVFAQRSWNLEAALAFDTGAERYPDAEKAPEAVYQALMQYVQLFSLEKKPLFKARIEERRKTLTSKYPTHDRAAFAQLVEGDQLVGEGKFLEAVESYNKVQASSPSYFDAQLKIGSCYYQHARRLDKDNKKQESAQFYTQAETILKKSITDFDKLSAETVNLEKQSRYENNGFNARLMLADLYLATGKSALVLPLLENADTKYANDADKLSQVWSLRIRALKEQKKLDEAIKLLDALAKKDPNSKAIGGAAGLIARELDAQAQATADAKKPQDADKLWRRAADYYAMSGRALLKGDTLRPAEVSQIAQRLYVLGLTFNGVPEGQDTFIGFDTKKIKDTKLWELSAELYVASLKVSPSTEGQLNLARISGFLGRWKQAADAFDDYMRGAGSPFSPQGKLEPNTRPEQVLAYIEMGVCELMVAAAENDKNRFSLAEDTLDRAYKGLPPDSPMWWYSCYYLVKGRFDRGAYREACDTLKLVKRSTNTLGGTTSLVTAFNDLAKEIEKKCP